jgi:hypothetical protein
MTGVAAGVTELVVVEDSVINIRTKRMTASTPSTAAAMTLFRFSVPLFN